MSLKTLCRKSFILLLIAAALLGVDRLSNYLTDGFGALSISSHFDPNPNWNIPIAKKDLLESEKALSQNYHYLMSGSQSYVFISEDGNYVIKFFKHKRWRLNPLLVHIPLPSKLKQKRENWMRKKKETIESTFNSCIAAYQVFKKETGVIYPHLDKTHSLQKKLLFSDRLGVKRYLEMDNFEFVIQKRAIPTDEYLLSLRKEGNLGKAKQAVWDLLLFTKKRAELGYSDKDPHLIRNFGFLDHHAVQTDIGGFHRDPKKDLAYYHSHEILKIERKLLPWLEENYPELLEFAQNQIKNLSSAESKNHF